MTNLSKQQLLDWLLPPPNPTPWIVHRRNGGWHIDWSNPEWRRMIRDTQEKAVALAITLGLQP